MLNHETFQLNATVGKPEKKQTEEGTKTDRTQDEKDRAEREYIEHRLREIRAWERKISGKG